MSARPEPAAASAPAGSFAGSPGRPRLKPWLRVGVDPDVRELVLRYGDWFTVFRGAAAVMLLPPLIALLDGTRDVAEIHATLGEAVRPATEQALAQLAERGALMDGVAPHEPAHDLGLAVVTDLSARTDGATTPGACAQRLTAARVPVLGEGLLAAECLRQLRLAGCAGASPCSLEEWEPGSDTTVVAPERVDDPLAAAMNVRALESGARWILALPFDGVRAIAGPMFIPGHTACHTCMRLRRIASSDDPARERAWAKASVEGSTPQSPALAAIVAGLVAAPVIEGLALREAAGEPMAAIMKTVALGFYGIEIQTHHLYRVPRCPDCSRLRGQGDPVPWHQPSSARAGP